MKHLFFMKDESLPSRHKRIESITEFGFIIDKKEVVDMGCNLLSTPIGYKRHDILDHTFAKIKEIPICPAEYEIDTNEVEILSNNIFQEKQAYSIFGLNGSDAIEAAIKTSRAYRLLQGQKKKQTFLSFDQTYHGSTELCLKLAGLHGVASQQKMCLLKDKNHTLLKNVNSYNSIQEFEENTLSLIEEMFKQNSHKINAVVQESTSWGANFRSLSATYWSKLRQLCSNFDVLLIIDDIAMCGGKTGSLFGFTVDADIFCVGKAFSGGYFPLSVCGISKKIFDVVKNSINMNGNTFSMHLPGIVTANYYHNLLRSEDTNSKILNSQTRAINIANKLDARSVSSTGSIICIELEKEHNTLEVEDIMLSNNLNLGIYWNPYSQSKIFWCVPFFATNCYFDKIESGLKNTLGILNEK